MKDGGISHPKLFALASALGTTRRDALGLLELLWAFARRYAPDGAVGTYADATIASAVDWTGDPAFLVEKLVETRWLDRDQARRLMVHDWHEHAPRYIRIRIGRRAQAEQTRGRQDVAAGTPADPEPTDRKGRDGDQVGPLVRGLPNEQRRLLAIAFPTAPSARQARALVATCAGAIAAGVPPAFLAHSIVERKGTAPWKAIDAAVDEARAFVRAANMVLRKKFVDLAHFVDWASAPGSCGPPSIGGIEVRALLAKCRRWPASIEDRADAHGPFLSSEPPPEWGENGSGSRDLEP